MVKTYKRSDYRAVSKDESDKELAVWIGLWMSGGAADRGKGSRNLHRDTRGRTGPHLEAMGSRETGKQYYRGPPVPGSRKKGSQ